MKSKIQNTAIVLFAYAPEVEVKHKEFTAKASNNKRIAESLYFHTLSEANHTHLPVFVISEKEQRGRSFGEKLANAFESVFIKGYENALVVGSDCPQINHINLLNAASILNTTSCNVVLGPSMDGGMYLIGLSKSSFNKKVFLKTLWQKGSDYKQFKHLLTQAGCIIHTLSKKADVDNCFALEWLVSNKLLDHQLYIILIALVSVKSTYKIYIFNNCLSSLMRQNIGLRAPPL